jgi:hypothetical protein
MIYYLVTKDHKYTLSKYLSSWGKNLTHKIKPIYYEQLTSKQRFPVGTYIFSDIERLSPSQAEHAAQLWDALASSEKPLRLLNHPTNSMRRYELLRTLYNKDWNQFNVYTISEGQQPQKFPVFIRRADDHKGSLTSLIHTQSQLDVTISRFKQNGLSREDKIIIEYCDTSDASGLFRKYSAFVIGEQIIPRHIYFSRNWMTKFSTDDLDVMTESMIQEEQDFMDRNPHQEMLRQVCAMADIQYGRVDYGMLNGVPQIWEINTNPSIARTFKPGSQIMARRLPLLQAFAQRYEEALEALHQPEVPANYITFQGFSETATSDPQEVKSGFKAWVRKLPFPIQLGIYSTFDKLASISAKRKNR